jgi:predicted transcriptional regulator of viral defense system
MKLIETQQKLHEGGFKLFSKLEFRRLLGISKVAAQKLLERYTKRGVLVRLKGGLYVLKNNYPSLYLIANRLYSPSYVSLETALSFYRLIPETVYAITCATTKVTRQFIAGGANFKYHKIKKSAFTGYRLIKIENEMVLFAEK